MGFLKNKGLQQDKMVKVLDNISSLREEIKTNGSAILTHFKNNSSMDELESLSELLKIISEENKRDYHHHLAELEEICKTYFSE